MLLLCEKDIEGRASRHFSSELRLTKTGTSAPSGHSYNLNFRRFLPSFLSSNHQLQPTSKTLNIPLRHHEHNGGQERIQGRLLREARDAPQRV
jgi:hypothetical protein